MAALNQAHANALLNASFDISGASVRVATGPLHLRLMTANGSATAAGTELATSGGYTSGTGAPTVTMSSASAGSSSNSAQVSITNMPASTIVGVEIWDSAGTPVRLWWGSMTSKTLNASDTLSFAASSIVATLS